MARKKLEEVLAVPRLRKYLKDRRFSYEVLAGLVEVTQNTVVSWMNCYSRPDLRRMFVIQYLTSGEVKVSHWPAITGLVWAISIATSGSQMPCKQ